VKVELDFIHKQSLWVTQKRATLTAGPSNASNSTLECLLPLSSPLAASGGGGTPSSRPNALQRLQAAVQLKSKREHEALRNEVIYVYVHVLNIYLTHMN
jgi:hypothetical protein